MIFSIEKRKLNGNVNEPSKLSQLCNLIIMEQTKLECDARDVMEQIQMAESRHMQMGALVSYQLQYPDMTIRDFFTMASEELEEQEEDLD